MFNKSKSFNMSVFENSSDPNGNRYGAGGFIDSYDPKSTGLEKWKPQEGENLIDVIPFNAGEKHPLVVAGKCEVGDPLYSFDYWVHKGIGPSGMNVTCLHQYGKRCPVCDESKRYFEKGDEESKKKASALMNRRRVVYVVHDLKTGKYGYWDTGYKTVEEKIVKLQKITLDDNGGTINPFDWKNGKTIKFYGEKKKFQGHEYVEPDMFAFVNRDPLSDEVLEHSVDLSSTVKVLEPEDVEKALAGKSVNVSGNTAKVSTDTPAPVQSAPAATSYEDMKPVESSTSNKPTEPAAPASAPAETSSGDQCPHGHCFGADTDKFPECSSCKIWDKCFS